MQGSYYANSPLFNHSQRNYAYHNLKKRNQSPGRPFVNGQDGDGQNGDGQNGDVTFPDSVGSEQVKGSKKTTPSDLWNQFSTFMTKMVEPLLNSESGPWRILFQSSLIVLHMAGAFVALGYLIAIATSTSNRFAAERLIQKSYYTTDYASGMHATSLKGFNITGYTPPLHRLTLVKKDGTTNSGRLLPILNRSSILQYIQPVQIDSSSIDACSKIPITDSDETITTKATPMDIASWRSCQASKNAPVDNNMLVDVVQPINALAFFSSSNLLFLLYNTLFLTGILALAFFSNRMMDITVSLALFILLVNFGFTLFVPHIQITINDKLVYNALRVPVNNVILVLILHVIVGMAILQLARDRWSLVITEKWTQRMTGKMESRNHTGPLNAKLFTEAHIFNTRNYVGTYVSVNTLQKRSMNLWKFQGRLWTKIGVPSNNNDKKESLLTEEEKKAAKETDDKIKDAITPVLLSIAGYDKFVFMTRPKASALFDTDFILKMEHHLTWIVLKYFEYSLTAGLFLVGVLLLFRPHADTYMYQIAYIGMFACNIIAIPLHKIFVHGATVRTYMESIGQVPKICLDGDPPKKDLSANEMQNIGETCTVVKEAHMHVTYAVIAFLVASFLFFAAGLIPFLDSMILYSSVEGMPTIVRFSIWSTLILFFMFAIYGLIYISWLLANISSGSHRVYQIMLYQNFMFEVINSAKWFLAFFICIGGLKSLAFV